MYLRPVHAETDIAALKAFVRENALGIFTTALTSPNYPLLQCTHIPWVYDGNGHDVREDGGEQKTLGRLRGHMARANPHAKALLESIQSSTDGASTLPTEVMVLFNAPHDSYVTPKFYVDTKPKTGKVVPTWNYAAAQIYGRATIHATDDVDDDDDGFISQQVAALTEQEEARDSVKGEPWKVSDAPLSYVKILSKAIIGISIEVTRLEGKYKMSQEMGEKDRDGVIQGFQDMDTDKGRAMASTVKERSSG